MTEVPYKPEDIVVPDFLPDIPEVRADLADYYQAQLDGFERDEEAARAVALTAFEGQKKSKSDEKAKQDTKEAAPEPKPLPPLINALTEVPAGVELAEVAAWTSVARVFINLDEFITRE